MYCTVPYFGFKAKLARICSCCMVDCTVPYFGFKAKLMQNSFRFSYYCTVPYFGFKAKRGPQVRASTAYCTVPYFGFKAKLVSVKVYELIDCTVPYFGFKAKRWDGVFPGIRHCTVPYFGFKAKLFRGCPPWMIIVLCLILDSRQNKYASGLMTQGGCPSLATQFQTDFCQSFFNGAGGMKLYVQNMAPVAEVIPSMLR